MRENDSESTSSDLPCLKVSDSAECLLLDEMREMLTQEWISYLTDSKRGNRLSRIRAGAPAAGELAKLVTEVQGKMSGEKYFKMQTFIQEFRDLPGVTAMEDTLRKLSIHLETVPPETGEVKYYPQRVIWLERFCHISGKLVGQMDVILGFLRGRQPREVLKKTKDLLASTSEQAIQASTSTSSVNCSQQKSGFSVMSLAGYCTVL